MERSGIWALVTIVLGIWLIFQGPQVVSPLTQFFAPLVGITETIELGKGVVAESGRQMNSGDLIVSEFIVQGGGVISLSIEDPDGSVVQNQTVHSRSFFLSYRAQKSGIQTFRISSNSTGTVYIVSRTLLIRTILGFDPTTIIGAILAVTAAPPLLTQIVPVRKRGMLKPEKLIAQIRPGQEIVVSSPSSDEYELLVRSFLDRSLLERTPTLYVSMNSSRVVEFLRNYPNHFFPVICDQRAGEQLRSIGRCEICPGVADLTGINITISKVLDEWERAGVVVLDIVSDVLLAHGLPVARKWLTQTLSRFKGKGLTVLAGVNPTLVQSQAVQGAMDAFDGHVETAEVTEKGKKRIYFRWVKHPTFSGS